MLQIDDKVVSLDVLDVQFQCDLCKCKGACCIEGDSGAPITIEEYAEIESILPLIENDLTDEARAEIDKNGIAYRDFDGELVTSLVNGNECVFVTRDEKGILFCAIDKAYREGRIPVQKPLSCELYPIRLSKFQNFTAVNYQKWDICSPALALGAKNNVRVYQFLKNALTRAFGADWYQQLCEVAELYVDDQSQKKKIRPTS